MATSRRGAGVKNILKGLANALGSLPSLDEKKSMKTQIGNLVEFLKTLQGEIEQLPAREDVEGIRESLTKLERVLDKAMENPIWQAALGHSGKEGSVTGAKKASAQDIDRWRATLSELETIAIDEIRNRLQDERSYSTRDLHGIANLQGIRLSKSISRDGMVDQIAKKISNLRGYRDLGDAK